MSQAGNLSVMMEKIKIKSELFFFFFIVVISLKAIIKVKLS